MSDYEWYEIIDGEEYEVSSQTLSHSRICSNINLIFDRYIDINDKNAESFFRLSVYFSDKDIFVPDIIIVRNPDIIKEDGVYGTPDLVVEILSKATLGRDRNKKFFKYEKYGVKEYWIVDPFSKSVEVYLLQNNKFILDDIYSIYLDYEWKMLTDKEKAEAKFEIKVSLYDDFVVQVKDIFERVN